MLCKRVQHPWLYSDRISKNCIRLFESGLRGADPLPHCGEPEPHQAEQQAVPHLQSASERSGSTVYLQRPHAGGLPPRVQAVSIALYNLVYTGVL